MILPKFYTEDLTLSLIQSRWASIINPYLQNPLNQGQLIKNVALASGTTIVNHGLGRMMQGWYVTDINGSATIYRSQPFNDLTLTLVSNAAVTVSLAVF